MTLFEKGPMMCGAGASVGSAMSPLSRTIVGGEKEDEMAGMTVVPIPLTRTVYAHMYKIDPS